MIETGVKGRGHRTGRYHGKADLAAADKEAKVLALKRFTLAD